MSFQTGNWTSGSTWVGGIAPSSSDFATIAAGHNVTVDGTVAVGGLTIAATGTLTANANTLTVGPTGGGSRTLNVSGTIALGGGTINHNGNLIMATGSTLNMTSGNFNVDGNNGTTAGSVATGPAVQELRGDPLRPGGVLRLRRDRLYDGLHVPPHAGAAYPGR